MGASTPETDQQDEAVGTAVLADKRPSDTLAVTSQNRSSDKRALPGTARTTSEVSHHITGARHVL